MSLHLFLALFLALLQPVLAAFGITPTASGFRVDTAAGLIFDVNRSNGDITSLLYHGIQYQASDKGTQINSGLGASTVSSRMVGTNYAVITVRSGSNPVTQYYVAKNGESKIYLATDIKGEVAPGELRFLARLRKGPLPTGVHHPVADNAGGTAIEGKDVFRVGSQTRCKFFSSTRFIDDAIHTIHGPNVSVSLIMPEGAYETASGGPFMRDINNQGTSDQQEFYYYMNSGHLRTEPWRMGFKGPYALTFSSTDLKANLDTSFFERLEIPGYVGAAGRGRITGVASGIPAKFQTVLHWHNPQNQYWTYAATDGSFVSPKMKPGTYTMKLYRTEYPVAQSTVSVSAGVDKKMDIANAEKPYAPIWRVGEFDGQPFELKNGDKFLKMHPSDSRMSKWGGTYTVGASKSSDFPMAIFAKTGGTGNVVFDLTAAQAALPLTLRVGTTVSFKQGRPAPHIGTWTGTTNKVPKDMNSRGITRGGYRGYGDVFDFQIPAGTLHAGKQELRLGVAGNGDEMYLSANYIVDAVELAESKSIRGAFVVGDTQLGGWNSTVSMYDVDN